LTQSKLHIRPFRPGDQHATRALILGGLAEHWSVLDAGKNPDLDDIAASYAAGLFLVACRGGEVIGSGALLPAADGVGRIVRMSVARHARRQGIGSRILHALLAAARARGYHRVVLETTATWRGAIAFYQAHGFVFVAERAGDKHFVLDL
jgi:ribosomal protein S18 acetylase RimI-like enzyme